MWMNFCCTDVYNLTHMYNIFVIIMQPVSRATAAGQLWRGQLTHKEGRNMLLHRQRVLLILWHLFLEINLI